jgi:hypothetical protein
MRELRELSHSLNVKIFRLLFEKFLHLDLNQGMSRRHDYNNTKITDQEEILWQSGRSSR